MDVKSNFGSAVRQRRLALQMSQEDLAGAADLDRTYVSGIERGLRNPTLVVMCKISEALNTKLARLVEE